MKMYVTAEKWRGALSVATIRICKDKKKLQDQINQYLDEARNMRENRGQTNQPLTNWTGRYFIWSVEKDGSMKLAPGLMVKAGLRPRKGWYGAAAD